MSQDDQGEITVVRGDEDCAMVLRGEFDLSCHAVLGSALEDALRHYSPIFVDLSGVSFLDASCVRELALMLSLHGEHLVLGDPSREVEVSIAACGMEDLVRFGSPEREKGALPRLGAKDGGQGLGFPTAPKTRSVRRALRR